MQSILKLFWFIVLACLFSSVLGHSHSPLGYDTLLVIVIVELFIAFSVGIICVIFSFNLFRALSDFDSNLAIGDLPPSRQPSLKGLDADQINNNPRVQSRHSLHSSYQDFRASFSSSDYLDEEELDFERQTDPNRTGISAIKSFTDYVRLW